MTFQGIDLSKNDYCRCKKTKAITSVMEDFGYWDVCCECGKPLEGGFHYFDHYDGEDHDDVDDDMW